jgi:hypothetical protein
VIPQASACRAILSRNHSSTRIEEAQRGCCCEDNSLWGLLLAPCVGALGGCEQYRMLALSVAQSRRLNDQSRKCPGCLATRSPLLCVHQRPLNPQLRQAVVAKVYSSPRYAAFMNSPPHKLSVPSSPSSVLRPETGCNKLCSYYGLPRNSCFCLHWSRTPTRHQSMHFMILSSTC